MNILNKLVITLPDNWITYENESAPELPTFINSRNPGSGVLQISFAEYKSGKIPNPSKKLLETMALNVCLNNNQNGKTMEQKNGKCKFGIFGSATVTSEQNRVFVIWYLSDSRNFVMASYINTTEIIKYEVKEADKIVRNLEKIV